MKIAPQGLLAGNKDRGEMLKVMKRVFGSVRKHCDPMEKGEEGLRRGACQRACVGVCVKLECLLQLNG